MCGEKGIPDLGGHSSQAQIGRGWERVFFFLDPW